MSKPIQIVLMTGNQRRHKFIACHLARRIGLEGVVSEARSPMAPTMSLLPADDQRIITQHLAERDGAECALLGLNECFPDIDVRPVPPRSINHPEVIDWVQQRKPDYIILYGAGIIKAPLLESYSGRVINLHLGLSPYYRGSGTNFWPVVNAEPECVGATIHLAVQDVDAGAILAQVRPEAQVSDRIHELGTRTILAAAEILVDVVRGYAEALLKPVAQDLSKGRVYRRKEFNAEAVRTAWRNLDAGLMEDYLENRRQRCERFPIAEFQEVTS